MQEITGTRFIREQPRRLTSNPLAVMTAYCVSALQQLSGIQIVNLYAGEIVLTLWPEIAKVVPVLLQTEGFFFTLLIFYVIDSFGRKSIVQGALIAKAVLHFVLFWCFYIRPESAPKDSWINILIIGCLIAIRGVFSLSLGPITWLYLP